MCLLFHSFPRGTCFVRTELFQNLLISFHYLCCELWCMLPVAGSLQRSAAPLIWKPRQHLERHHLLFLALNVIDILVAKYLALLLNIPVRIWLKSWVVSEVDQLSSPTSAELSYGTLFTGITWHPFSETIEEGGTTGWINHRVSVYQVILLQTEHGDGNQAQPWTDRFLHFSLCAKNIPVSFCWLILIIIGCPRGFSVCRSHAVPASAWASSQGP